MGADGLSGVGGLLPPPAVASAAAPHSAALLVSELSSRPAGTVTVVALGPLTNLALAEQRQPGVLRRAKEVRKEGGAGIATPECINVPIDFLYLLRIFFTVCCLPASQYPFCAKTTAQIIAMAGAFNVPGNMSPDAEFNVLQVFIVRLRTLKKNVLVAVTQEPLKHAA
jgi:inosine-uridine nucleoside N-ribohydrolase